MNSVSKSFLGILIGGLIDKGLIDTARLITEFLPDFVDTGFSGTAIQPVLNMTGSVKYEEDYLKKETDFWQESSVVGWRPVLVSQTTLKTLYEYAKTLKERAS